MHTTCSDGFSSPERLAGHLLGLGLDVVAVTDHDTLEGSWRVREALAGSGPEVVIGEEVSSGQGHVLALFIEQRVRPGMPAAKTIDAIHEQGGLAIAAHPMSFTWAPGKAFFVGVGDLAWQLPFDAVELVNGAPGLEIANRRAMSHHRGSRIPAVGGSDAHVIWAVGHAHTRFPGRTGAALRKAILGGTVTPAINRVGQLVTAPISLTWLLGRQALRRGGGPGFLAPRLAWEPYRHDAAELGDPA